MSQKSVVLAVFPDEPAADAAVVSLKQWDKSDGRVNLSAIGVLVLDDSGEVKVHKLGSRSTVKGGGIGLVLAVLAPPVGVAAVGGGALLGALHHKGLGLTDKDRDRLSTKLLDGKAAVGVLAREEEAVLVSEKLVELGGQPELYAVSEEALKQAEFEQPAILPAKDQ